MITMLQRIVPRFLGNLCSLKPHLGAGESPETSRKLLGKRKSEDSEELDGPGRKWAKLEETDGTNFSIQRAPIASLSFSMSSIKKGYTSVVSWLFPQLKKVEEPTDDDDEVQIVKVVERKEKKNRSHKSIQYDPLPTFKGFSKSKSNENGPSKTKPTHNRTFKKETAIKAKKSAKFSSKVLKAREVYRKMLERGLKKKISEEHFLHFEEFLKVEADDISSSSRDEYKTKKRLPDVVDIEDSEDEDVIVLEEEVQILNDLSKLKTEIELVVLDTLETEPDVVEVTDDESENETDEDEAYYENRTFVRKECNIEYNPEDEDSRDSVEPSPDVKILEKDARSKSRRPPAVTQEMQEVVRKALQTRDQVLVSGHRIQIHSDDLLTLQGLNWLNDEVINFYLSMVAGRASSDPLLPSVHVFTTFFLPRLLEGGHSAVAR